MISFSNLKTIKQNFFSELYHASRGEESSLSWLVNIVPKNPIVENGEEFQVLVIGGSVCRRARVVGNNGKLSIINEESNSLPVFDTSETFFKFVEKELYDDIRVLAINFAFGLAPVFEQGKLDGILVKTAKEHKFSGLMGKKVGLELEKYLLNSINRNIKITLANDTICLLLSGLTDYKPEELASAIVGTGVNTAFFPNKNSAVNLESGEFNKFPMSEIGSEINRETIFPGKYLFEKGVSGRYLYKHFNKYIEINKIPFEKISSTNALDDIAVRNIPKVSEFAAGLLERSAQLVACQIAGIVEFKARDMVFIMDGSLFWKGYKYKETVEATVKKLVPDYEIKFEFVKNSTIYGAARLVC